MLSWRQSTKIQRSTCTPRWYCQRRFRVLCSIHRAGIISITNDSSKSHGYHIQTARVAHGQAADAVSAYTQVKMEDAPKLLENSKIGMSRHLDSSTTTQMAKIMVQYGRSSRSGNYSYLCMWTTSKLAGKKQNIDPMWKVLNKEVDLGEPTSFFDDVYLDALKDNVK